MSVPPIQRPHPAPDGRRFRFWHLTRRTSFIFVTLAALLALGGCFRAYFEGAWTLIDERAYTAIYPYFAEYCGVSEFNKKKGSRLDIAGGGPGGHSVFYLNGVCSTHAGYPEVVLCPDPPERMAGRGVGLSVNEHYRNANWVATEGRDFFYHGALAPGEAVTQESYDRTVARAKAMGVMDGIVFHDATLKTAPPGMSERDFMYEISTATDFGVDIARDRYCARVPLDRAKMQTIVQYLNAQNARYRYGREEFRWQVLSNNCAYLAHNTLAAVGFWPEWPTDRPIAEALFSFPVPKNEFVNFMRRANDLDIAEPDVIYTDATARAALVRQGWLVSGPGGLAEARQAVSPNAVYNTHLRLIFFDDPNLGNYQVWFDRIFADKRYTDLGANLRYYSALFADILARQPRVEPTEERNDFQQRYRDAVAREKLKVDRSLAKLPAARS